MRRFPFSIADAQLREERYNLLNSYLATVPANHAHAYAGTHWAGELFLLNLLITNLQLFRLNWPYFGH